MASMKTVSFQEIKLMRLMVTSFQNLSKLLLRLKRIVLEVDAPYQQLNIFKSG